MAEITKGGDANRPVLRGSLLIVSHKRHELGANGGYAVSGGFPALKAQFARHAERVRLCVPVYPGSGSGEVRYPGNLSVIALPPYGTRLGMLNYLPEILRTLWREIGRADLVYAMCPTDIGLLALLLARLHGRPVFLSIDTDRAGMAGVRGLGSATGRLMAWIVGRCVNGLLVGLGGRRPAFYTGGEFLGARPLWRQWIKTTVTSGEIPEFRRPTAGELPRLHVTFAGRLTPEKNVGCLIAAVAKMGEAGHTATLTVVGQGSERAALEEMSRALGGEFVRFAGEMRNSDLVASRFVAADVLVLPSLEERQGKVLLEAMACSVPVVAARAGGIPSVISHGDNGLLFDPKSPQDLAACLVAVMKHGELRAGLAERGYDYARRHVLDDSVAEIMSEVMRFYRSQVRCV